MSLDKERYCPKCNTDLQGQPIPKEFRHNYSKNTTHYSRVLGIQYLGGYDGVSEWRCPDCDYRENRFTGEEIK